MKVALWQERSIHVLSLTPFLSALLLDYWDDGQHDEEAIALTNTQLSQSQSQLVITSQGNQTSLATSSSPFVSNTAQRHFGRNAAIWKDYLGCNRWYCMYVYWLCPILIEISSIYGEFMLFSSIHVSKLSVIYIYLHALYNAEYDFTVHQHLWTGRQLQPRMKIHSAKI